MTQQYAQREDLPDPRADVVALLKQQHGEIRNLFDEVERATGADRGEAFRRLMRMLAIHETAEQEIVHPFVQRTVSGGAGVVRDRLREEESAKRILTRLDSMDTEHPEFLTELNSLRTEVLTHARAEERYEFTHLYRAASAEQLARLAKGVRAAEAVAPTHPHPEVQGAGANLALGPLAALIDRTRDAIRSATGEGR